MTKFFQITLLLVLLLLSAQALTAQFHKKAILLEMGINFEIDGKLGLKEIDLARSGFSYYDSDVFQYELSVGRFTSARREWLSSAFYHRNVSFQAETFNFFPGGLRTTEYTTAYNNFYLGIGLRQYYPLKIKRLYAGFSSILSGNYTLRTRKATQIAPQPIPPDEMSRHHSWGVGLNTQLFATYMMGQHLGARVSFGNLSFRLSKDENENFYRTNFILSLRGTLYPGFSIFWLFHAKEHHRD